MGTASSQTRLRIKHLLKYLRAYSPDGKETDEEWSGRESTAATVGDIITIFKPTNKLVNASDVFELEVDGVCLVFGEDADLPMNYFITDGSYEMSFLEGTLSAKANEAKEKGLSLYCLRSSLLASVGMQTKSKLGQMRKLGGSGERKSPAGGLVEPLCQFFSALAIKYDPSMETEPLSALNLAVALWGDDNQKSELKGPDLDASFMAVEEENGGLNIDLTAVSEVAAEPAPQANSNGTKGSNGAADGAAKMAAAEKDAGEVWDMLGSKAKPAEMKEESDLKSLFKKHSTGESKKMSSADALFGSSNDEIFASDDFFSAKSVDEMFGSSALTSADDAEAKAAAAEAARLKAEEEEARQKAEEESKAAAEKAAQEAKEKEEAEAKAAADALFQAEAEAKVAAAKSAEEAKLKAEDEAKAAELALFNAEAQAKEAAEKADQEAKQKLEEEAKAAAEKLEEEARKSAEEATKAEQTKADSKVKAEEEAQAAELALYKAQAEAKEAAAKAELEAKTKAEDETKAAEARAEEEAKAAAAKLEEETKAAAAQADEEAKSAAERLVEEAKEAAAKAEEEAKAKSEEEAKAKAQGEAKADATKAEDAKALDAKSDEQARTAAEKLVEEAKTAAAEAKTKAEEEAKTKAEEESKAKSAEEEVEKASEVTAAVSVEMPEEHAKTDATDLTDEVSSDDSELKDKLRAQAKGNEDVLNRKDLPTRQKIELLLAKQKAAAAAKAKAKADEAAAESAKLEQKSAEDTAAASGEDKAVVESKPEAAESEDAEESESTAADSISRPQKKLSLQATLTKLEEQSQKAHLKIDEFKRNHELACREDLHLIESKSASFESDFKERLNAVRKEIVVKMRKLSVQATDKLSEIIDEGKVRIEERGPHSLQQLENVGKAVNLSSVDKELDYASSKFASHSLERLSVLNLFAEGKDPLDAIVEEEIARIREWRATELQDYIQLFEKVSGRFESRVQLIISEIDGIAKSILDEIERLRDFDTRRYETVARELSEAIANARRFGEMHARAAADNALSRKVFPALAEIKENLSKNANELRAELAKKLDEHANQSIEDFDKILDATKECFNKTADELNDLKKTSIDTESQAVAGRLSKLQSHLTNLQEELRKSAEAAASGSADKENSFEVQAEEIGKNCSRDVADTFDRLKSDLTEERKAAAVALKNSAENKQSELTQKVKELFEKRRAARQDALKKLDERLDQLAESVDAISSQLIQ